MCFKILGELKISTGTEVPIEWKEHYIQWHHLLALQLVSLLQGMATRMRQLFCFYDKANILFTKFTKFDQRYSSTKSIHFKQK